MSEQFRPRLLSTSRAAEYLAISPWQLRELVHSGKLHYIPAGARSWRFDIRDLDAFVDAQKELVVLP